MDEKNLVQRFRKIMPDLEIEHFELNQEGLANEVAIINRQFVFRRARTEESAKVLDRENRILDLIRPRVSLKVPTPLYFDQNSMVYPIIEGFPLSREMLTGLDIVSREHVVSQLGEFLEELHATEIPEAGWELPTTPAPVTQARWLDIRERVENTVYPLLLPHQIKWAQDLFENALGNEAFFKHKPVLIHGDLAAYHLLFDPGQGAITGVIDFGVAGIGDPALDLGNLITTYGESFVTQIGNTYQALEKHLPRARFYAQSIELQWVLLGLETGEDFWFTAHLGNARDVRP